MKTTASIAISTALFIGESAAHKQYCDLIPNCVLFLKNNTGGLGHVSSSGGGPRNKFGLAFGAANHDWKKVCDKDSDGDGVTNGCEVGDCCCRGVGKEQRTTDLALPGDPKSMPMGKYDSSECENVPSSSTLSTPSQTKSAAGNSRMSTAHLGCIGAILAIACIQLL